MNATVLLAAYVFVLAVFLGIVLIGAILVAGTASDALGDVIGALAVFLGALNVVGGFVVTDRMLGMFRARPSVRPVERAAEKAAVAPR